MSKRLYDSITPQYFIANVGMFVPSLDKNWIIVTLAMIGKFCISASFAIIYVFSAELFPTVVRNVGVGSGSFWARVGGVVAPYIGELVSSLH